MIQVLTFIGMSTEPIVRGMYMQKYQESIGSILASFPFSEAYDLIFLTACIASLSFVVLAIILKRKNPSSMADPIHNH